MKRDLKIFLGAICSLSGLILLLMIVAQIVLSPKVCTALVEKYAPDFIDGKLEMNSMSVSLFSHFPAVTAEIDGLVLTYPSGRFSESSRLGADGMLVRAGNFRQNGSDGAVPRDTLAAFDKFNVSLSLLPLMRKVIRIKEISLTRPRAFVHIYGDNTSNLDILTFMDGFMSAPDDSSSVPMPRIILKRLSMDRMARVVYTDQRDTLMATVLLGRASLDGHLTTLDFSRCNFDFALDSLLIAGRYGRDTLLFGMDSLRLSDRHNVLELDARADAYAATHVFGRMKVPVGMKGQVEVSNAGNRLTALSLRNVAAEVATVRMNADMDVTLAEDPSFKGSLTVPELDVQSFMDNYLKRYSETLSALSTDAKISFKLDVDGLWRRKTNSLPAFRAVLAIPECSVCHSSTSLVPRLCLNVEASCVQDGPVNAKVNGGSLSASGFSLSFDGGGSDLLGEKPLINAKAALSVSLDTLDRFLSKELKLSMGGHLVADFDGKVDVTSLNSNNIKGIQAKAKIDADKLKIRALNDSLNIFIENLSAGLARMDDVFSGGRNFNGRDIGAFVKVDSVYMVSLDAFNVQGRDITGFLTTSSDKVVFADTSVFYPLSARVNLGSLFLEGVDSLGIRLRDSENTLKLFPSDRVRSTFPAVRISSHNKRVFARKDGNATMLSNLDFDADTRMVERGSHVRSVGTFRDSLYRLHPDWTRDSVMNFIRAGARSRRIPQWLREEDFKRADIKLDVGASFRNYMLKWNVSGNLSVGRAAVASSLFPIRTAVTAFGGSFDNDHIAIDSLGIKAGSSRFYADGRVGNLRQVLLRNGTIRVNLNVGADTVSADELLAAYARGRENVREGIELPDDEAACNMPEQTGMPDGGLRPELIVVPANLDAKLNLDCRNISFSGLDIHSFLSGVTVKERCAQLSGTKAVTSAGKLSLDAFYSTVSKKRLLTGFEMTMEDVRTANVISLLPQVDTLIPLLKSFDGMLNCNLAATARFDTVMNVIPSTIDGVIRISGSNLHFNENEQVSKISRKLFFRSPDRVRIDTMKVEGIISDGAIEIFPFILKVDPWTMALAGVQELDKSFNYHISLIKSPLLFKIGANISGSDFDHFKFKLGKPAYRSVEVPVFSQVIDEKRLNLKKMIQGIFRTGVDNAVQMNGTWEKLRRTRDVQQYGRSIVYEELEGLDREQKKGLDDLKQEAENREAENRR